MKNRINSLWTLFQERRLSRRTFMKSCVALTAILGLPPTMLDTVVKAAETTELPTVIWLHGHECTGCSESFIRSSSPFTSDVILNMISLEYDDTLAAASGAPLEEHLEKIIKEKAETEDCVIVGRCADYLLRIKPDCRCVFITAPLEKRIRTISARTGLDAKAAKQLIKKVDKQRKYYYENYTDRKWGKHHGYDLCLDSSRLTKEQILKILTTLYETIE